MPLTMLGDPREQPGAFITDGTRLYQVQGTERIAPPMKVPQDWVIAENSSTGQVIRFELGSVKARMRLVDVSDEQQNHQEA